MTSTGGPYLSRDEIAAYVGQDVTIRRHLSPKSDRSSVLTGRLTYVGERNDRSDVLPGKLMVSGGESALDLALVLDVRRSEAPHV